MTPMLPEPADPDFVPVTMQALRSTAQRIAEATAARRELILELHHAGVSLRSIAEHAGISHVTVDTIIRRSKKETATV